MFKIFKSFFLASLCILLLSGCVDEYGNSNNAGAGTVAGVLGGAFIGSQMGGGSGGGAIAGGIAGAALGGVIGNSIGRKLDAASKARIQETSYYALDRGRLGEHYKWSTSQASGYVIPTREYYVRQEYYAGGRGGYDRDNYGNDRHNHGHMSHEEHRRRPQPQMYCREYTQVVNIGGRNETAYGKACRQPDGQWKVVS